jgi:hypothetical protein
MEQGNQDCKTENQSSKTENQEECTFVEVYHTFLTTPDFSGMNEEPNSSVLLQQINMYISRKLLFNCL